MLTNPHEQHSWNKNQFMSNLSQISLKNHNHKTLNIRCFKPTKKGEGLLPQVEMNSFQSLRSNKPKIQAFGEELKFLPRLERRRWSTAKEKRKKVLGKFSKSTNNKPPYYAIALVNSWPLDQIG
ncbi:hypothetical protein QL285_080759 [Trifolium repens]|nr:hypothetical protein QL285_080759 [Trifolium repens]